LITKSLKFILPIVLVFCILLAACSQETPVRLLNAQGFDGVEIAEIVINNSDYDLPPPLEIAENSQTTPPAVTTATTTERPVSTSETTPAATVPAVTTAATTAPLPSTFAATPSETTAPPVTTTPPTTSTVATTTLPTPTTTRNTPLNHSNVRGVWISYIELQSSFSGRTAESFRAAFAEKMENCKSLGINTVYVHLRAFGDAYYESEIFPWAKPITGNIGQAPGFDPLKIMLEEAHARGISFHGWLNPMRLPGDSDMSKISTDLPLGKWYNGGAENKKGTFIVKSGDNWFLNPAYPEVRKLITDGAAEILRNYNIDGLHIDDYFYPPNTAESFDRAAFSASDVGLSGGHANLSDFRLENCTKMVKSLYEVTKAANPALLFGISPQGNIENCYALYADVRKWASQVGYCDYIAPQLYYGFNNATQPFDKCLEQWENLVKNSGVKLIPGLAIYKIGLEDAWAGDSGRTEWLNYDDILKRQMDLAVQAQNYGGVIFFSYNYLFAPGFNTPAINTQLTKAGVR